MRRKAFIIIIYILVSIYGYSQTISVSSFKLLDTDLTANTAGTIEVDQNGETAALIKVVTTQTGFTFDGGALGIVKTVQKPSEIWVYVPRGLKKITISHPHLGMLRDYYLNIPIEAARTYEMILVAGEVHTVVKQARTSQYVVFKLTPPNAVVELDGELLQTTDGTATKMMKFGSYTYKVQAPNYLSEAGIININDPKNKHVVIINLKPNYSVVTFKVDGDAEIWLNGELKGKSSWTGNLGAGTYEIETKKTNHRSISTTKDITITHEPQTINLQSPMPIYGEADINSAPAMADIYIDGKEMGQTPQTFSDLLIGRHQLRVSKKGYKDYSASLIVKEGEITMVSASLEPLPVENIADKTSSNDKIRTFTVKGFTFNMIRVEGGTFTMGATKEQNIIRNDEKPAHKVTLSSYYIGETEVTQGLWKAVMGGNPSDFVGTHRPVENVSWHECQRFIEKLNNKTGLNFRLPTEAEWEFAARGGNKSQGYTYSGSNNIEDVAWYYNNSNNQTHAVKTKRANELGLYDMTGNVDEWCQDWYNDYSKDSLTNPTGPSFGFARVNRGGAWLSRGVPVSYRNTGAPDGRASHLGLRLALY